MKMNRAEIYTMLGFKGAVGAVAELGRGPVRKLAETEQASEPEKKPKRRKRK